MTHGSRDSAVGIATGYGRMTESRNSKGFSLLHIVQTGHGDHPVSYAACTEVSLYRGKAAGTRILPSTLTNAEIKKTCIHKSILSYVFMAQRSFS
jgi:hypothetical protein